jgi:type I restriction-modification system DNA methylase subunit
MKQTYLVQYGKETWKQLQEIVRFGYSASEVFSDFVEVCLAALLSFTDNLERLSYAEFTDRLSENRLTGIYEERYMLLVKKYKENATRKVGARPADFFKLAWDALQKETSAAQEDILGEIFESQISLGEHGQFFTPSSVSDMMVQLLSPLDGETVSDPCCGSGRFFISLAKQNPYLHFYGVDVSPVCARMAALNMWLFNINADIYQGNSLSMEMSYLWHIRKGGFVWEKKVDGSVSLPPPLPLEEVKAAAQATQTEETPPIKAQPQPVAKRGKKKPTPHVEQQTLFDE